MHDSRWSSANIALRSGLGAREQSGAAAAAANSGPGSGPGGGMTNGGGESGILRKPGTFNPHHPSYQHHDNFADLLVFGYSCKVFRDDEKARFIDQGRHLIPWMGDNQLKIDRYDARGALHDLSQHEPPLGGYGNRMDYLPPSEQRAEQLCEEERYYSLYTNEVEEEIEQEEAAKRQAASGAEIAFDYDAPPSTEATVVGPEPATAPDDENSSDPPFVAPTNFEIPTDLDRPDTMKEHAIIEKTAKFIASQDSQMEILLRAKQAANPQFNFLSPGGRLYRYYRHVLMAVKTNQYPEDVPEEEANGTEGTEAEEASSTVVETSPEKPKVVVPVVKYKPSIDCAYTQLISKITGAPIPTKDPSGAVSLESPTSVPLNPTPSTSSNTDVENAAEEKTVDVKKVSTGLAGLVQYDSDSDESGSDEEEKKKEKKPEPETERREITFSGALPPEIFQHVIEKTATYVAKNGYSFEEALRTKNDPRFLFLRKDHEFYPFYAFRVRYLINPFEEVPKSPEKVTITREIENGTVVETPSIGIKTVNTAPLPVPPPQTQIQANKPGGAVCFSIKSKDDGTVAALKSNVVQELGGDEEEPEPEVKEQKEKSKSPAPASNEDPAQKNEKSVEKETTPAVEERTTTPPPASTPVEIQRVEESKSSTPPLEESKPASTSPDTAVDGGSKDQKRLEDRIKDKLAVAARERLASIAKEKQLQLERKKKASMFLSLINKNEPSNTDGTGDEPPPAKKVARELTPELPPPAACTATPKNGLEQLKNQFTDNEDDRDEEADDDEEEEEEGSNDSSNASVHSVPSISESSGDDDVVFVAEDSGRASRSRTRSKSVTSISKPKKRKHKHKSKSKKSKKKKSRSRSRSRTPSKSKSKSKRKRSRSRSKSLKRSRSRPPLLEREAKKAKKKKSKKKSHKRSKSSRSSSISSKHHHHRKEQRERSEWESD